MLVFPGTDQTNMAMQQVSNDMEEVKRNVVEVKNEMQEAMCLWPPFRFACAVEIESKTQGRR